MKEWVICYLHVALCSERLYEALWVWSERLEPASASWTTLSRSCCAFDVSLSFRSVFGLVKGSLQQKMLLLSSRDVRVPIGGPVLITPEWWRSSFTLWKYRSQKHKVNEELLHNNNVHKHVLGVLYGNKVDRFSRLMILSRAVGEICKEGKW